MVRSKSATRAAVYCLLAATLIFTGMIVSGAQASAARRKAPARPVKRVAPTRPKVSPTERLASALVFNGISAPDDNLATACGLSNFKNLLYSLDGVVGSWDFTKGEFETSSDFDARMAKLESAINGDRKTIICKSMVDDTPFIKYDADAQGFNVDNYALEKIATDSKDVGSYTSSTRMGVKAKVYASVRIDYNVDLGSRYNVGSAFGCATGPLGSLRFPVESDKARAIRAGGYLVLIGHLRQPFYSKREESGEPTLDDPFDEYIMTLTLKFAPEQVFLVTPSGERIACSK